jgi:hypothetical protein
MLSSSVAQLLWNIEAQGSAYRFAMVWCIVDAWVVLAPSLGIPEPIGTSICGRAYNGRYLRPHIYRIHVGV